MAKQLNVSLAFTADTGRAKAQLKDLQNQLEKVTNLSTKSLGGEVMAQDIEKATLAAATLKAHLEDATNVKTGKLDLGKLSEALDTKKLKQYRSQLEAIGIEGQKAFMMLAQSITDAEVPLRRTNNLISELWVTMKNTARWQLTSSAMHGFMSAVSGAYGYAQDLNESLNNIRIVSGQSTEEMAKFAEQANKAAKALSATTTDYTNAALIYYQQGLPDEDIKERTEITIKMANVARQSAEIVSDQLTAVWNNFYKEGEKSLQHYADVMTALGAATASSTDEIAGGLEKFASIADMIGLSFEYAASSLATITATTRQSEEVVGTALKTIFARIQGLKLGETLEDGTDLNKYSDSLKRVGIEIFDTTGELKDMDDILDEIGARWDSLAKSEQVALAQAVAGIRQYNQLVSLMDNWDYFQENLNVAMTSEGALDEQAKIYEESWEAARDRVRTALESIYSDIIKDEAFIDMLNNIEKVITGIDHLIDSVGGLRGVLTALGVLSTKVFGDQIAASLQNIGYSINMTFGKGKEKAQEIREVAYKEAEKMTVGDVTYENMVKGDIIREQAVLQRTLLENSSKMSQEELQINQYLLDRVKILGEIASAEAEEVGKKEKAEKQRHKQIQESIRERNFEQFDDKSYNEEVDKLRKGSRWHGSAMDVLSKGQNLDKEFTREELEGILKIVNPYDDFEKEYEQLFKDLDENAFKKSEKISTKQVQKILKQQNEKRQSDFIDYLDDSGLNVSGNELDEIAKMVQDNVRIGEGYSQNIEQMNELAKENERLKGTFKEAKGEITTFSDSLVASANVISGVIMAVNSLSTAWDTLNDPDLTTWEKFTSISMTLITTLPIIVSSINATNLAQMRQTVSLGVLAAAKFLDIELTRQQTEEEKKHSETLNEENKKIDKSTGELIKNIIEKFGGLGKIGKIAGLVGVAIFALIKAFEYLYTISPEGIFRSAQEQANNAAEAFGRVSTKIDELKNSFDGLESSYDKIENLTKGTLEWYQAVADVNAEVLKLKDEYSDLEIFRDEKGILRITEESQEKILEEQTKKLLAAQGAKLQADKNLLEAEYNVEKGKIKTVIDQSQEEIQSDFHFQGDTGKIGKYNQTNLIDAAAQYYNHPLVGEGLFSSKDGAQLLAEGLYSITEADEGYEEVVDSLYNLISNNEDQIVKLAEMQSQIENYDKFILDSHLDVIGTNRSTEELGIDYTDEFDKAKEQAAKRFENEGGWQDHINYTDYQVENNQALQDFMAMQGGEEVKYVANRDGKLFLDIDGNIEDFTEEYVYESLAELEISDTLKETVTEKIKGTLNEAINNGVENSVISLDNLSEDQIIGLDNFHQAVQNKFDSELVGEDRTESALAKAREEANSLTSTIVEAYGAEGLNEFLETIEGIDLTSNAENIRIFNAEIDRLREGLNEQDPEAIERFTHAMDKLSTIGEIDGLKSLFESEGKSFGLDDEEISSMQDYAKYIAEISEESEIFSEQLATNANNSANLAIEITRMNKGVKTLGENFADWNDILKKSTKESAEYMEAMVATKKALADVLDVESDLISNEFIANNLDQIKKASEGNAEAIDALRAKMDEEIIQKISIGKDEETIAQINSLNDTLQSLIPENIEIGMELKGTDKAYKDFVNAADDLVKKAGMTADEANAYFAGIGYEPVYSVTDVDATQTLPNTRTKTVLTDIGFEDGPEIDMGPFGTFNIPQPSIQYDTFTEAIPPTKAEGDVPLIGFSGDGTPPDIKGLVKKATGAQNNYSAKNAGGPKSTKGGGGSSGSKVKKSKRSDVVDRYKEITDQLDDVQDAASDVSKEMDRLYGANRLKAIDKQNDLIQKEISLLKIKRNEALAYLEIDRKALQVAAQKAGVNLEIGVDGNISNYTNVMNNLFDQLEAAENAAGETADEAEQKKIEAIQEKIEELKSAISQYDETRELLEDLDNELEDKFNEWQDNNYEKLTYSLELKLEINDMELERLDYFLNKFADNFYKMAESAGLMMGQIDPNKNKIEDNQAHKDALDMAYQAGEISQADYIEGLKTVRENLYDTLDALNELDKTMLHYYEDTLAAATEELADHTDHMEHLTSVFDHYINLMNILGKSKNYDAIGDFLGGKADTIRDRLEVAQSYYNMLLEQKENVEAKLNAAIASGDDAAIELYKEEWDAIVDEVDAAQEQVLSLTEEWSEAMKAVIENNMAQIAETLEKTLTGGINFDELMDNFDKLNTRQEEYLTKTNQIYETNKLMRTANKALDETDNTVAKQKLKNFIEETKSLQQNTRLSEYELEIQKAKYDLLLAEIALEEAQNAKSTVRMSQDNEGNFGYVFTADQDDIDDAQQGVEDAENRLYNISLEGQQEYTEKYLQAQQEMYNELTELQQMYLDGQIASEEEYNRRKEEILNHYLNPVDGILSTYSHLYNIAVQTDADATADYWAKDYGQMTQNTEDWKIAVNEYLVEVEQETDEWKRVSEQANEDVQNALENSSEATRELTEESEYLAEITGGDVVDALEDELDAVAAVTEGYANQRAELLRLIEETERYLELLGKQIEKEAKYTSDTDFAAELIKGGIGDMSVDEAKKLAEYRAGKQGYTGEAYNTAVQNNMNIYFTAQGASSDQKEQLDKAYNVNKQWTNSTFKDIMGLDTGGYTGAWGPEGKLAVLHEKELVLNADDTSNLLTIVSFVRDLVNIIDGQAQLQSLTSLNALSTIHTTDQTLEQQVTIHAEFPYATDRYEIEEAFNSLVNRASQFANRK